MNKREGGFTLVELMIVVLVVGILLAVAIPAFLGARKRSHDAVATSHLSDAYTSALTITTDSFALVTDASLAGEMPGVTVSAGESNGPRQLSLSNSMNQRFGVATRSASGACFGLSSHNGAVTLQELPKPISYAFARCDGNTAAWYLAPMPPPPTLGTVIVGANGHGYEFVPTLGDHAAAIAGSAGRSWNSYIGHLAVITSVDEQFAARTAMSSAPAYIAGSDAITEGDWRFDAGPQLGTSFWSGGGNGTAVAGHFNAWTDGEPNNAAGIENCAVLESWGFWNDVTCWHMAGFLVEYEP
jgi:prepilin-type N-terminal cleavage/methylation domain-containing protein